MRRLQRLQPALNPRLKPAHWVEMAVRFVAEDHGIRKLKDVISRAILDGFDQAGIGIASGTYDLVGLPEVKVRMMNGH